MVATQNPVEIQGTFPLPEAQLDRFLVRLKLGYPDSAEALQILKRFISDSPLEELGPWSAALRSSRRSRRSVRCALPTR